MLRKTTFGALAVCAALVVGMVGIAPGQVPSAEAATAGKVSVTAGQTTASVKWSKAKKATRYKVLYKKAAAKSWGARWVKSTSTKLSKLKAGTAYTVRVKAYRGKRVLWTSAVKRFTTKKALLQQTVPTVKNLQVSRDTKFNGIWAEMTIADFNKAGFQLGDSVDVTFSNGFTLKGLPYYDGYYVRDGKWLVVGYPGYPFVKICMNNNSGSWEAAGVVEGETTVIITRAEAGAYATEQETFAQVYTDDRSDLPFGTHYDQVFANFRAFCTGNLKAGTLYRSASPCDEVHNRPQYVDALMKDAGVNYILNLADSADDVERYITAPGFADRCPYFMELYSAGKLGNVGMNHQVLLGGGALLGNTTSKENCSMLDLGMDFRSAATRTSVAEGLRAMLAAKGPYLVHCTEGKDRTGFVCFLLEALAASTYDEMVSDYMITYDNYYGIRKDVSRDKYNALVDLRFDAFVQLLCGDDVVASQVTPEQFAAGARAYLLSGGMTDAEVDALVAAICA